MKNRLLAKYNVLVIRAIVHARLVTVLVSHIVLAMWPALHSRQRMDVLAKVTARRM